MYRFKPNSHYRTSEPNLNATTPSVFIGIALDDSCIWKRRGTSHLGRELQLLPMDDARVAFCGEVSIGCLGGLAKGLVPTVPPHICEAQQEEDKEMRISIELLSFQERNG